MRANKAIAVGVGIDAERVLLADDGVVIDLVDGKAEVVGYVPVGFVYVDGSSVGDVTETLLKDRRVLGEEGFISIFAAVDMIESKVVAGPELHARGLGLGDEAFLPVIEQVRVVLEEALADGTIDVHELQQRVRKTVGKWVGTQHRRRPMIVPVIIDG
jgi:ribonuclease J